MDSSDPMLTSFSARYDYPRLPDGAWDLFGRWREEGRLGFLDLPGDAGLLQASLDAAERWGSRAGSMVVTGIGGSSLGLVTLLSALREPSGRRVEVVQNPDARTQRMVRDRLDPRNTVLTAVTKSGGTAETVAGFLGMYQWLRDDSRVVAVTDPEKGDLRALAEKRGWDSLPVPPGVGGRFSVLSPVGMFPAAYAGIDIQAILRGAGRVVYDFDSRGADSLAGRIASAFHARFATHPIHVFFVYSDRLESLADWFAQLWAESLGKGRRLDGSPAEVGQTPLACLGPSDQHSLVQLFMEGPEDKTFTFLTAPEEGEPLPGGFEGFSSFEYLEGITPEELRSAEADATAEALSERGLPVSGLSLDRVGPEEMGEVIMALEIATVLVGLALEVDPLDQPGVERGKVLTYRALGRPGYE
ncbi:MAG: glucose-6-phosphate isomerase [Candidatus Fermentibacterota bacterium]